MAVMFDVIEPATGERLASVPEAERHDVDRAVAAAERAFRSGDWPKINSRDRGRLLFRLAALGGRIVPGWRWLVEDANAAAPALSASCAPRRCAAAAR